MTGSIRKTFIEQVYAALEDLASDWQAHLWIEPAELINRLDEASDLATAALLKDKGGPDA